MNNVLNSQINDYIYNTLHELIIIVKIISTIFLS